MLRGFHCILIFNNLKPEQTWPPMADDIIKCKANSRFAPSQWEMVLLCNDIPLWLDTTLESARKWVYGLVSNDGHCRDYCPGTLLSLSSYCPVSYNDLTHWGRVKHICIIKLTITGSDNGLSPDQCQAFIWINVGILLIGPLGTNFSETLIRIHSFTLKIMHLKMSSVKWQPFSLSLNRLPKR